MADGLIEVTDRGPSIGGRRVTVYDVVPYLLGGDWTEVRIAGQLDITSEEVAAARAYIFDHADTVLAQHLRIEERLARGNPPEVAAAAERGRETMRRFTAWLDEQRVVEAGWRTADTGQPPPPPPPLAEMYAAYKRYVAGAGTPAGAG